MGTSFCANFETFSGNHLSKLRNPLIADALHRSGAVEICLVGREVMKGCWPVCNGLRLP